MGHAGAASGLAQRDARGPLLFHQLERGIDERTT